MTKIERFINGWKFEPPMPPKKRSLGAAFWAVAAITGFAGGLVSLSFPVLPNHAQERIEPKLEEILRKQEERVGLRHFGTPAVVYDIPKEELGGIPYQFAFVGGVYDPKSNTVYLRPRESLLDKLHVLFGDDMGTSERVLEHELGHFYADQLSERIGLGDFPDHSVFNPGVKLVSEGIAEYFRRKGTKDEHTSQKFPKRQVGKDFPMVYKDIGYPLVKPIIDQFSKAGIAYLIQHPPSEENTADLHRYQHRALDHLALEARQKTQTP